MFGFQESIFFEEQSCKYFSVVQINGLRFKFGLSNGICSVLGLVFEFLNLNYLFIILVGTKACLSDKKSFLSSLHKDKLLLETISS